jgi:VIT1/CCC1 family predicted Fe2+/Mn2+ transporter
VELGYIDTPEEWRDLFIMMFMVAGTLLFMLGIIIALISGYLGLNILNRVRGIFSDYLQPAAENVKEASENVKGTVTFVSENAVKPVVKAYGVAAGAKRFVSVASKVAGRGKKKEQ